MLSPFSMGQHQEISEKPGLWKEKEPETDTTSILSAFRKGKVNGHFRYFFMATGNREGLTDYYAHAAGGGIKFETGRFKNFQVGISGFFAFNIGSSDLSKPDPETNQYNRYEIGLYDIKDPSNKKDIDRLEELYLKYHFRSNLVTLGKQLLNTPFINLQDGRMRPTEVEGIWTEIYARKKTVFQFGYLYHISPRSTVRWFRVDESIGQYPSGVNEAGTKSGYAGNLHSKGILMTGISREFPKGFKLQAWDLFAENIFNSAFVQADYEKKVMDHSKIFASVQWIRQDAVHDGGNPDPAKTYFSNGTAAVSFGARFGWKNNRWESTLNYNRITAKGKYLMPREWGRDPFFTFMPRERNEGLGDVQAITGKLSFKMPAARLLSSLTAGYYKLPDVLNYRLNKYGLPSYNQLNLDLRYQFTGVLKGLETQLLFVYKKQTGPSHGNDKYVINKVDMTQWNLVMNYQF